MNLKRYFKVDKKGFTLAEILLTLTVIGIVAALTIPSLIQSVQDSQFRSAWKSAFSDLSQATTRLITDNGGSLKGVFTVDADIINKYSSYLSYAKKCPSDQNCWHDVNKWYYLDGTPRDFGNSYGYILNNGSLLTFAGSNQTCSDSANGLSICGYVYVDINGFKNPNTVGKDIYLMWIQETKLTPAGAGDNSVNTCNTSDTGYGCAARFLMQ